MIRHALGRAMLGAAFLALTACSASSGPSPITASGGPASASPSAHASPTPASSPSASASRVATPSTGDLTQADIDRPLTAGTYRVGDPFGAPFGITVPDKWQLKTLKAGDAQLSITPDGQSYPAWIVVDLIENVFADPCKSDGGPIDPPVATNVDAVVKALTHMTGYTAGPVTDVTIGGHKGKAVEIANDIDTDTAGCDGGKMLPMWTFRGGDGAATNGHATEQLWVLDVNGTPVIVDGETFDDTPPALRDAIKPIVETIAFN